MGVEGKRNKRGGPAIFFDHYGTSPTLSWTPLFSQAIQRSTARDDKNVGILQLWALYMLHGADEL